MPPTRKATHAGSWYSSSGSKLDQELSGWLGAVESTPEAPRGFPVKGCKAIIAPHAGYSYSGPPAAWAYKSIDVSHIDRVFVLGPSHHVYLDGCALSTCSDYTTPLGPLTLDHETIKELRDTGKFLEMALDVDQDEHSIEMQLPYIRKIFTDTPVKIVPLLVGAISTSSERAYGALLAPYLASPSTLFVISSDFCHWGSRFSYTFFQPPATPSSPSPPGYSLSRSSARSLPHTIHESISKLDHAGMSAIAFSPLTGKKPSEAHEAFAAYLAETHNTICGRHPIGVLLAALATLEGTKGWEGTKLEWVQYARSSLVERVEDSSVSYASGVVIVD